MVEQLSEFLTRPELAKTLKIQTQTLATWTMRGEGPAFVKVGRAVRYRRADVERWLAGRTHNAQPVEAMA